MTKKDDIEVTHETQENLPGIPSRRARQKYLQKQSIKIRKLKHTNLFCLFLPFSKKKMKKDEKG